MKRNYKIYLKKKFDVIFHLAAQAEYDIQF